MPPSRSSGSDVGRTPPRRTAPRTAVLQALQSAALARQHLTAEALYRVLAETDRRTSLATVYRVLAQLEAARRVHRLHFADGKACFELATDQEHFHVVNVNDGSVLEFNDDTVLARLQAAAAALGLELLESRVTLYARARPVPAGEGRTAP